MLIRLISVIILICLFLSGLCYSQEMKSGNITGYVTDQKNGEPIEDVNVFIENTIFGSSTDENGYYEINNVPPGDHDIVASMVGYKINTKSVIISKSENLKITFKLKQLLYELSPQVVIGDRPVKWLKNLKKFKEKFLGAGEFSDYCHIQNPEVLEFTNDKNGNLIAKADMPMYISNEALGYKIYFILTSFIWKPKAGKISYFYKAHFSLMESEDVNQIREWKKNRKVAYEGSTKHFFYSLIMDNLRKSDMRVFQVKDLNQTNPLYLKNVINNPYEYLIEPSIIPDEYVMKFSNYLKIIYYREAVEVIDNINQSIVIKDGPQISWLKMKGNEIIIDRFGNPQGILPYELFGHWSGCGVSEMLPKNYLPK